MAEAGAAHMRALVRRPGPRLPEGLVTHPIGAPVNVDLAGRQWRRYVDALRAEGWEISEVPPADSFPDAVFVEDTVVVFGTSPSSLAQAPTSASPRSQEPRRRWLPWAIGSPGSSRRALSTGATS